MSIKMVREPSDTPNITNIDDFIGLRYSYGNQNGYVKGKGSEIDYEINGSTFKVKSGRIVVQGVECDVDANGVEIAIDSIATQRYHAVYLQVNLATMSVSILEQHDTASYPSIPAGDDFNEDTTGTAHLVLYHFTSLNGAISDVSKLISEIVYSGRALEGYDINKGTIEERLTVLGFKHGSIYKSNDPSGTPVGEIIRQGNFVIIHYDISGGSDTDTIYIYPDTGTPTTVFLPKNGYTSLSLLHQGTQQSVMQSLRIYDNYLTITSSAQGSGTVFGLKIMHTACFGYEALHDTTEYTFNGLITSKTPYETEGYEYQTNAHDYEVQGYKIIKFKVREEYCEYIGIQSIDFVSTESYNVGERVTIYALKITSNA